MILDYHKIEHLVEIVVIHYHQNVNKLPIGYINHVLINSHVLNLCNSSKKWEEFKWIKHLGNILWLEDILVMHKFGIF
jgi:hypothetical protein